MRLLRGHAAGADSGPQPSTGLTATSPSATLRPVTAVSYAERQRASGRSLRLGVAYPGDPNEAGTWSGTPASLGNALRDLGAKIEPLRAEASPAMETLVAHALTLLRLPRTPGTSLRERARVSRTIALYTGREMSALRTRALRRHVQRAMPLDGVIQIGTAYAVPNTVRVATFEDMTVEQALSLPYPEWRGLSAREQASAVERGRRAYVQAAACCFTTRWAADSAINDYGVPAEKTHVVGVGRNHTPRPVARDWDTPRFIFVGGDWKRKNGDAVVRCFLRLREAVPSAHLDLIGSHPTVDAEGITGHGWLSLSDASARAKLDGLFERATCFVMPSLCEPSAISYVEAAAAGIPSIGSTVGGSAELIGEGGCVVDPSDEAALYDAMLRFADGEKARAAGARALARADFFTWAEVARRILTALAPPDADTRR